MSKPVINNSHEMKEEAVSLSPLGEKKESTLSMFSRLLRLDGLSVGARGRTASESEMTIEPPPLYYGVYIPCEIKKGPDEEALHVYKDRSVALELVKRYKQARFKTFRKMQDAVAFALRGADPDLPDSANTLMGEKPYPFKGPSPQDMVALRKAIEAGLYAKVRDSVWENPRYLVSSGNTPAILQEGSRYNALHVGAKALNAEMCNLILTTVGDPEFVQRLYGGDADEDTCREFASLLVESYLNMPDKGLNETPLHFAAKFSAVEVVDVLAAFPQCNKQAVNKYGEQPKDIICNRNAGNDPQAAEKIIRMLGERYYVPVFHSEDDSRQPTIGNIFSPGTPPNTSVDPLSPRLEIRAFAGPMEAGEAARFRRRWKTPSRPAARPGHRADLVRPPAFRLNEITKGLECVGRNLAVEMKVGWKEYWPFLDTFTDFRTTEGLQLLENYLSKEYEAAYSLVINSSTVASLHGSPDELSVSRILNSSTPPKNALTPISDLCVALKGCSLASNSRPSRFREGLAVARARRLNLTACYDTDGDAHPNRTVSQLMCIERTCQVFAKRIADALNVSLTADAEVAGESLRTEAKHLQHTMSSYMDDERFRTIDFALIHYRLSQLVVLKLLQHTSDADDIATLVKFLETLRNPTEDTFGSDDEKRPVHRYGSRRRNNEVGVHVSCVAQFIAEELSEGRGSDVRGPSVTQEECSAVWAVASKCACEWARDSFDRGNRRNASFKRNQRRRSTSPHCVSSLLPLDEVDSVSINTNRNSAGDDPSSPVIALTSDKCQVLPYNELISEDESEKSSLEDEDECDGYHTASEHGASGTEDARLGEGDEEDKMADTSDQAAVEAFIYGEEPSKMDRLVYEALADVDVDREQFPHVYRWRHTVALCSPHERNKWLPTTPPDDSMVTPIKGSLHLGTFPGSPVSCDRRLLPEACSSPIQRTPNKIDASAGDAGRAVPLQVSSWLRVTGLNSPTSASASKNVGHNVSFGF